MVATDLPAALTLLAHNASVNATALSGGSSGASSPLVVRALPWGDDAAAAAVMSEHGPFDAVVGADIVYDEALFPILLQTIDQVYSDISRPHLWSLSRTLEAHH